MLVFGLGNVMIFVSITAKSLGFVGNINGMVDLDYDAKVLGSFSCQNLGILWHKC